MLTHAHIIAHLRRIIGDAALVAPDSFGLDDDLAQTGVDSLSLLRAIAEAEREFGIAIPDERFGCMRTLRALAQTVEDEVLANAA
jgi:acyl carrier protein